MQGPDWQIGRVFGIPIHVHASWLFVFFFVTWSLATGYLPDMLPGLSEPRYWGMGGVAALLLFASVLLHELGHSLVALRYRIPIGQITLFIFGGVAQMRKEPPHPRAEFLIAIAGPIVSFLLAGLCIGLVALLELLPVGTSVQSLTALGVLLGMVNTQLGLFNLLPGFPLDGGRALRAGLWAWSKDFYRATSQAAMVGLLFGIGFCLFGAFLLVGALSGTVSGALASSGGWIVLIGAFLFSAARGSRKQAVIRASLASVSVRELMVNNVVALSPDMTLEEAVNQYFLPYGYGGFPVVQGGRLVGIAAVRDVQTVNTSLWAFRRVGDVMRASHDEMVVSPDTTAIQALEKMMSSGAERLIVVQDGELLGLLTRASIGNFIEQRHPSGMGRPA
ncbi:MAG: putative Membrane-associated zinc metallopeptidase containing domain pair [Nitrospira sp.]|jgi:Zn-dependent protease/predicted transcriptional regulator|nr:putative Membrane-associated zinc metallopeptidase containing domain pair [Nitrospira sp.]